MATGDIDVYMREMRSDGQSDVTWDHMPGALIATEAGCSVRHFSGKPVEFEPRGPVAFERGVVCFRGTPDGGVGQLVSELTS